MVLQAPHASNPTPQGYILQNRVTHIRELPVSSTHAFRYSTLSLLLGLDALESGQLDLASGLVFSYGGRWGRLLGLRPQPYLNTLSSSSIRQKLEKEFRKHHRLCDGDTFQDAWIMTMPSILGFEGINPLTVYFCYKDDNLWIVVLEIHNTFGESHIHLLQVGNDEVPVTAKGYDHQWTFRRQFHVSPFNDRSGFYTVLVKSPSGPPGYLRTDARTDNVASLPVVCIRLYTERDSASTSSEQTVPLPADTSPTQLQNRPRRSLGKLKLAAFLRTTSILPLTTKNVLWQLMKQPFVLFLTMPRILYHASILHFSKRLDVFPRPEPHRVVLRSQPAHENVPGGGVGWQEEGTLESYARKLVLNFLQRRTTETGISVVLTPSNPNIMPTIIRPAGNIVDNPTLEISYLSPRFFTALFLCPSSEHTLLLGSDTEGIFRTSSADLFTATFSLGARQRQSPFLQRMLQRTRRACVPDVIDIVSPTTHFLDSDRPVSALALSMIVLWSLTFLDYVEKAVFHLTGSRFVDGHEPWNAWKRAAENWNQQGEKHDKSGSPSIIYGSVRRGD